MVDVGGYYRSACSYFIADKFRSDESLYASFLVVKILTDGHIFHFRSNYAFAGIVHLGDAFPFFRSAGKMSYRKTYCVKILICKTLTPVFAGEFRQNLCVVAVFYPFCAGAWQTFVYVIMICRISVRPRCVVDDDILIGIFLAHPIHYFDGWILLYLAHGYLDGMQFARYVNLL